MVLLSSTLTFKGHDVLADWCKIRFYKNKSVSPSWLCFFCFFCVFVAKHLFLSQLITFGHTIPGEREFVCVLSVEGGGGKMKKRGLKCDLTWKKVCCCVSGFAQSHLVFQWPVRSCDQTTYHCQHSRVDAAAKCLHLKKSTSVCRGLRTNMSSIVVLDLSLASTETKTYERRAPKISQTFRESGALFESMCLPWSFFFFFHRVICTQHGH